MDYKNKEVENKSTLKVIRESGVMHRLESQRFSGDWF